MPIANLSFINIWVFEIYLSKVNGGVQLSKEKGKKRETLWSVLKCKWCCQVQSNAGWKILTMWPCLWLQMVCIILVETSRICTKACIITHPHRISRSCKSSVVGKPFPRQLLVLLRYGSLTKSPVITSSSPNPPQVAGGYPSPVPISIPVINR